MPFITNTDLTYGNLRDELSMLIIGSPPKDNEPEFRRVLKEAVTQLLNEAAASPDSLIQESLVSIEARIPFFIQEQYSSIVDAWVTSTGKKYSIIDMRTFQTLYPRTLDATVYEYRGNPILIDLGVKNSQRQYIALGGEGADKTLSPEGNPMVGITVRCNPRPPYGNVFDDKYWTDSLMIYPNCLPAIKEMMISIRYGEQGNTNAQIDKYNLAIKYLNDYLRRFRQGAFQAPNIIHQGGLNVPPVTNII